MSVGIKVRDKESIDRALRRFKRAVNRSRVLRIYRGNMAFTKPSEERRLAKEKAMRNARKRRQARCGAVARPPRRSAPTPTGSRGGGRVRGESPTGHSIRRNAPSGGNDSASPASSS